MRLCPIKVIIACRSFEEKLAITGVTQENPGLTLPPNSLDLTTYTKPKNIILNWPRILASLPWDCASVLKSHTHHLEYYQPPIVHKPTTTGSTIYKCSTRTKLCDLNWCWSEGKLSNPWDNNRKSWTHLLLIPLINNRAIKAGWLDPPLTLWNFSQSNKQKIQFELALNKTFCPTPPPLSYQQLKHPNKTKVNAFCLSLISISHSSQYQNWQVNMHSILLVIELGLSVSKPSTKI